MTSKLLDEVRGTIGSIANWFVAAKPNYSHKDFQVQLGVHFEEISEMCDEITAMDPRTASMVATVRDQTHLLAERLKTCGEDVRVTIQPDNRTNFLDSLCDQIVTATGTGEFASFSMDRAVEEVDLSNWSKFTDGVPVFDENGKIAKGPEYFKADLEKYA